MVFHSEVVSPGVHAPDDPHDRGRYSDIGGEYLILSFRAWIASPAFAGAGSNLAMTGADYLDRLSSHCSIRTPLRNYRR